jgi:hypothetical protein
MKTWQKLGMIGVLTLMAAAPTVLAQDLYHAQEWSADLFGTSTFGEGESKPPPAPPPPYHTPSHGYGSHHDRLGVGVGVNYFFCKYFGVGADVYSETTAGWVVRDARLNLIGRLPIGNSPFAPYAIAGGGREFQYYHQWEGHMGAGLEIRFLPHASFFFDGQYVLAEHSDNYGLGRAGFRYIF